MPNISMQPLYQKLKPLGFSKSFIASVLPSWWCDDIANTESGYIEAASMLSNIFNVDLKSLLSEESPATFRIPYPNFKATSNVEYEKLSRAVALSTTVAKACLRTFNSPLKIEGLTPTSIRETLLSRGNKWVDFRALLEYVWEIGIPVLFLEFPKGITKMQGLAISVNDRPVIILTSNKKYGYLEFDLAHELGHILANHLEKEKILIDENIKQLEKDKSVNILEQEANSIALEILTGKYNGGFETKCRDIPLLVDSCIQYGKEHNIDPSHLVLNIGHNIQDWRFTASVLNALREKLIIKSSDPEICKEVMFERLENFGEMKELENMVRKLTHLV